MNSDDADKKDVTSGQIPADWMGLDIGPKSVELFQEVIKNSKTLQTAKEIGREIDGLVYTASRQPLSDADKRAIKELIDRELGLPTRMQKSFAVESASNDDLSDLADVIENILGGNK